MTERVVLLYAYYPSSASERVLPRVRRLAEELRDIMDQECIAMLESAASTLEFV